MPADQPPIRPPERFTRRVIWGAQTGVEAKKPTAGGGAPAIRPRDSEPTQEPTVAETGAAAGATPALQRNNKRWAQLPAPPQGWPDATLAEIALVAFHDRTITSPNHPLIDEMRCGLPPTDNFTPQPTA